MTITYISTEYKLNPSIVIDLTINNDILSYYICYLKREIHFCDYYHCVMQSIK